MKPQKSTGPPATDSNRKTPDLGLVREVGGTLAAYLRGQFFVSLALSGIYAIGFALIGMPAWPAIALLCGFLNIIPYFGGLLALLIATLIMWAWNGELWRVAATAGVYALAQGLESFFLTPWILGRRLQLRPLVIFIAVLAGGALFGFFGLLLAVPALAVGTVLWRRMQRPSLERQK